MPASEFPNRKADRFVRPAAAMKRSSRNGPLDMRRVFRIAIILLAAIAAAATANALHPKRIAWFVTRDVIYPPPTPEQAAAAISRDELLAAMQQGAAIVDARKAEHFEEGHIPGAINIPLKSLGRETARQLESDRPVIVYCHDYQ
jgi:hypothetical protein